MRTLKRTLSFLFFGKRGSKNRRDIIELLRDRPYNTNQMAKKLSLNYRTIKHHLDLLLKHELVSSSHTGRYGEVFFLSPDLEGNMHLYDGIIKKAEDIKQLSDFSGSSQFYRDVLEHTYEGVIIVDIEWDVFFWNESASRMFGYRDDEMLQAPLEIFFPEEAFRAIKDKLLKDGRLDDYETLALNGSGEQIDINVTIDPILNGDERAIGYSILSRDITARKRAEAGLAERRRILETILEHTATGLAYMDVDFNFINVNSTFAEGSGLRREELVGQNHLTLFPNRGITEIFERVRDSGETVEVFDRPYKFIDQPKRGVTYWDWSLAPVKDDNGRVVSLVLSLKETTTKVKEKLTGNKGNRNP